MSVGTATEYTGGAAYGAAAGKAAKADAAAKANIWDGTGEVVVVADRGRGPAWTDSAKISPLARQLAAGSELSSVNTSRTAGQEKFTSVESREAEGARLDAYLADLRTKYGEAEAISRFNEYMRSEGYEIYENVEDSTRPALGGKATGSSSNKRIYLDAHTKDGATVMRSADSFYTGPRMKYDPATMLPVDSFSGGQPATRPSVATGGKTLLSDRADVESFNTVSVVNGSTQNGKLDYGEAATWAMYHADNNPNQALMEVWKNMNLEKLKSESGFDVSQYIENFQESGWTWGKAFAAESVSTGLSGVVNALLDKAGVKLESGDNLSLFLDSNQSRGAGLTVNINFGDDSVRQNLQNAINKSVAADPSLLRAFMAEDAAVKKADVEGWGFSNGIQSSQYVQKRMFLFSADNPSAVVMGSGLDSAQQGYTYVKKLSNSFDAAADRVTINSSTDDIGLYWDHVARTNQLVEEVRKYREA